MMGAELCPEERVAWTTAQRWDDPIHRLRPNCWVQWLVKMAAAIHELPQRNFAPAAFRSFYKSGDGSGDTKQKGTRCLWCHGKFV